MSDHFVIKFVNVHEPWATLAARGLKPALAMGWQTLYRGWVALYVPGAQPGWVLDLARRDPFLSALAGWEPGSGEVVGVARLAGCHTRGRLPGLWRENARYGDYKPGSWLWELADPIALDPIPHTGRPGIHDLPPDVVAAVLAQVPSLPSRALGPLYPPPASERL